MYQDGLVDEAKVYTLQKAEDDSGEESLSEAVLYEKIMGRFTIRSQALVDRRQSDHAKIINDFSFTFQTTSNYSDIPEKAILEFENDKYIILKRILIKGMSTHHLVFFLNLYHG